MSLVSDIQNLSHAQLLAAYKGPFSGDNLLLMKAMAELHAAGPRAWALGTNYSAGDFVVRNNGIFVAKLSHTSTSIFEPGVPGLENDWTPYWYTIHWTDTDSGNSFTEYENNLARIFVNPLLPHQVASDALVNWWEAADAANIASAAWSPRYGSGGMLLGQSTAAQVPTYSATGGYDSTPCLVFDGAASPNSDNLYSCNSSRVAQNVLLNTSCTVVAIICPKATTSANYAFSLEHSTVGGTPTGLLSYWGAASAGQSLSAHHPNSTTPNLARNRWQHVGIVANCNPIHYINGEGVVQPSAFTAIDGTGTANQVFRLGARVNGGTITLMSQFDLMAFGIWNRPLSGGEMRQLSAIMSQRIGHKV